MVSMWLHWLLLWPKMSRTAWRPSFVSTLKQPQPLVTDDARRSPCVSAPRLSRRLTTAAQKRRSPPRGDTRSLYSGAETWFDRWDRPICWIVLSADQGSSSVMWTRRRWFLTRAAFSAWSEMPDDAASEMMATSLRPAWNSSRS